MTSGLKRYKNMLGQQEKHVNCKICATSKANQTKKIKEGNRKTTRRGRQKARDRNMQQEDKQVIYELPKGRVTNSDELSWH